MFWFWCLPVVAVLLGLLWLYDRRAKRRHTLRGEDGLQTLRDGAKDSLGEDYGTYSRRGPMPFDQSGPSGGSL